ncbi:hypothetical protein [Streptomyces cavourensis]|uniref:Uncharacterized protein n=1 Tax=Streptomyces cavourensis TaxID=67258 RepID=A0ABY5FIK7_9ACTN|nr:hypothetical protein [Streptomyces cavourensis]UTR83640.1 hypothetical protein NLU04_34590 [Streptomyces cavourensis]
MRSYIAVEIDGVLAPCGGPVPAAPEPEPTAWWQETAPRAPRPDLSPAVGRALAGLPADLVLLCTPEQRSGLEPLLPTLGWDTVPPLAPLRDPRATAVRSRAREVVLWAHSHDRPVAWVRAGSHHVQEVSGTFRRLYSTVGPLLPYAVDPTTGLTPADVQALRQWLEEMSALPTPAPVAPRPCRNCGERGTTVHNGRRIDNVDESCGSCCECYCTGPMTTPMSGARHDDGWDEW